MAEFICPNCFKKGFIPSLIDEQKINDRIAFLENYIKTNDIDIQALMPNSRIDELRKLLE